MDFWPVAGDAVSAQQFLSSDQFEVVQDDVRLVAIPKDQSPSFRNRAVNFLPDQMMDVSPTSHVREVIIDLAYQVTIPAQSFRADRHIFLVR